MGKYVEKNLNRDEKVVKNAKRNGLFLLGTWIKGIFLCWLLFIPTIKAIIKTIQFRFIELGVTNKRIIGKVGVFNTKTLDAPLDKIQNVMVVETFFGKIFNYGTIKIDTASGSFLYDAIKDANSFKTAVLDQIEQAKEELITKQASQMAQAMAGAINK